MPPSSPWQELGDGVFRRRYSYLDQNIGLVLGAEAALVIDTRADPTLGRELLAEIAAVTNLPVRWVFKHPLPLGPHFRQSVL